MEAAAQRRRALQKANATRSTRAALKKRLASGDVSIGVVLALEGDDRTDWDVARDMRVDELLASVPGVGRSGADEICDEFDLPRGARFWGTTTEMRNAIVDRIREGESDGR